MFEKKCQNGVNPFNLLRTGERILCKADYHITHSCKNVRHKRQEEINCFIYLSSQLPQFDTIFLKRLPNIQSKEHKNPQLFFRNVQKSGTMIKNALNRTLKAKSVLLFFFLTAVFIHCSSDRNLFLILRIILFCIVAKLANYVERQFWQRGALLRKLKKIIAESLKWLALMFLRENWKNDGNYWNAAVLLMWTKRQFLNLIQRPFFF